MSFNSGLNPNVVKTALDDVFFQTYNISQFPHHATAENPSIFMQDTADSSAIIMEQFKGVGQWEARLEEENQAEGTPRIDNQKTFNVVNYDKMVRIPKIFFDDNKHGSYEKMVKSFAQRARTTRDKNAFAAFRNAFTTELTADGIAWIEDAHTNLAGSTVDNELSGALSASTLFTAIQTLAEQKAQDDEIDGHLAAHLVVPIALFDTAVEITGSTLKPGTSDNEVNVINKFGINIYTSPYLGAAAGGSNTAWFLLSDNHSLTRWVREGVWTDLVDYKYADNNVYKYKGGYRETVGVMSYEGAVGSLGT